jgi:subfamily B ATP-binding cassette protein MsbA
MSLLFLFVGYYNVTIADLLVFGFAVARLYTASKELTKSYSALLESVPASHRVFEILDQSEETKDVGEELGSIEDVEIKDLTFSYDGQSVLQGVSLKAKKGEIVAVVGRSGVGKSTLVDLITGFYNPVGGQILFNGRDSNVLSKTSIISHIAVVPQETFLFNTTIEENLRYARPDANENEVVEAAKSAGIHSFICTLDAGYETVVGERGAKLSGGEKQRISIARALIRRPSLLILDEPTSNLDGEAEKKIEGSLQEIAKSRDRITFIIAHRLSTIKNADRIYVLDQGRIAETGTHNELLAKNGVYSSLYSKHSESDSQRSEGRTAATGN